MVLFVGAIGRSDTTCLKVAKGLGNWQKSATLEGREVRDLTLLAAADQRNFVSNMCEHKTRLSAVA